MTHDQCKEQFVESLYHELDEERQKDFTNHLRECSDCRKEFAAFEETFRTMSKRNPVVADEHYSNTIWDRVHAEIETPVAGKQETASIFQFPPMKYVWSFGIAAVLLIAVGIYMGKTYFTNTPIPNSGEAQIPLATATTETVDSVSIKTQAYLERSKVLLQGLVNIDEKHRSSFNLSRAQHQSRELVRQAAFLTAALDQPDQQQVRQLINDLQIILLQLANLEVKPGVPALELIEKGVDKKSILFKINLEELRSMAGKSSGTTAGDSVKTNL